MSVLLIAGSPTRPARASALLDAAALRLQRRGVAVQRLAGRELPSATVDRRADAMASLRLQARLAAPPLAATGLESAPFSRVRCWVERHFSLHCASRFAFVHLG